MIRFTALILMSLLTGFVQAEDKIPQGFEMQILEPTGGKILRPIGWFYCEGHREKTWMWTISKEDTHDGKNAYDTGVRIQAFTGVQERTGKAPEVFIKEFVAEKKKTADIVHKNCDAVNQGLFTRTCIEVTQGDYRILYSAFWGNEMDIAIISIAGAKTTEWNANAKFFNTMSAFELIDMDRFSDDAKKKEGEKDGTAQPATAPDSKSESNKKPETEADERPQ